MKSIWLSLGTAAVLLGACAREPEQTTTGPENPVLAARDIRIENFALGTKLGPYGGIAKGSTQYAFEPDERIYVAMEIKQAPVDTPIRVIWKGPGKEVLGEETKMVRRGQRFMYFMADASSLPTGEDYSVEISVHGRILTELNFDLLEAIT